MSSDAKSSLAQMEKIVSLCKRRGFIYQSSEIYGGCGGVWDYGPLGAELKRNLRTAWWNTMTREREDVLGLDASILMNPAIWKASGHVDTFADLMRECSLTNKRVRADHVEPQEELKKEFRHIGIAISSLKVEAIGGTAKDKGKNNEISIWIVAAIEAGRAHREKLEAASAPTPPAP